MAERYLDGGIQKEGKLTDNSVRFLQIGCGFTDFKPPTGRRRFSTFEKPFPQRIGTERNGALARELAEGKYDWVITGSETIEDLPDELRDRVTVVRDLPFARCQYRLGVSALAFGVETLDELEELIRTGRAKVPQTLQELRSGTRIATKHINLMGRIIKERSLGLRVVHDDTPETAPEFHRIYVVADNYETGKSWRDHEIFPGEVFLEPHAVLAKARRLHWGKGRMFNNEFLPRVDEALEHPERWLNPETQTPADGRPPSSNPKPKRRFWDLGEVFRVGRVAIGSALLFTLLNNSVILDPWHSRTSKKKELRS